MFLFGIDTLAKEMLLKCDFMIDCKVKNKLRNIELKYYFELFFTVFLGVVKIGAPCFVLSPFSYLCSPSSVC